MSLVNLLKKGFGYVLMSMGVSSPNRKPAAKAKAAEAGTKKSE
jgi:hypothetical protein